MKLNQQKNDENCAILARNLLAGLKSSVQILRYANLIYQSRITAKTTKKLCAASHRNL